jgi:hypothetical protein
MDTQQQGLLDPKTEGQKLKKIFRCTLRWPLIRKKPTTCVLYSCKVQHGQRHVEFIYVSVSKGDSVHYYVLHTCRPVWILYGKFYPCAKVQYSQMEW